MNQFKQIFGSLPRHAPSNSVTASVAASGCQTESILRNGRRYLRTCSLPRNVQSAAFVDDRGPRHCRRLNDESTQAYLYGRPKLALFHNRNSSMDKTTNLLDVPFHRSNISCDGKPGFDRKTLKTEAYRPDGAHIQSTLISTSKSRTYANMIAEYSEAMEKKKQAKKSSEKSPRGLLARLPFESVVSSLTKLERTKLSKGRVGASNSLAAVGNRSGKESNHALTDTSVNNDKRKASPTVKKDLQKRDYFTKNEDSPKKLRNDFDFIRGYKEIENEKENFDSKWIRSSKSTKSKRNSISITIDEFAPSKSKETNRKFKKLNVLTSEGNIEIKIPVYDYSQCEKKSDSEMLAKSREKSRNLAAASNPCVMSKIATSTETERNAQSSAKTLESTNFNKPPKSLTPRQSSTRHNKAIPWWASPDCISGTNNKPRSAPKISTCLNDVYASSQSIQVMLNEQVSQIDKPAESRRESLAEQRSARRGKKMTSIAKITRHMEEQLEDKRRQEVAKRTSIDKTSVPDKKSIPDAAGSVTKSAKLEQIKAGAVSSGAPVIVGSRVGNKKEALDAKKDRLVNVLMNKQEDKNLRSMIDRNVKFGIGAGLSESICADTTFLSKLDKNFTPSISILRDAVQAMSKKSNKSDQGKSNFTVIPESADKENMIDHRYKVKRISDALRPIEKKKDGTLIDYGLKVPTRKPKPKRPSEKSTAVKDIPKKTISAPHHQQQQPTTDELSQRKSTVPPKLTAAKASKNLNPVLQSRSEMPLTKTSKLISANDRLELQSKQKPAIRAENLVDKNRGKPDGGLASGKSDNGSCVGAPLDGKNNKSERDGNCTARSLANGGNAVLTLLNSEQMFNAKNAIRAEINVCENESVRCVESDRPEKELIYSAWLNRFHTRKHTRTLK